MFKQVPNGPTETPPNDKSSLGTYAIEEIATSPDDLSNDIELVTRSNSLLEVDDGLSVSITHCKLP